MLPEFVEYEYPLNERLRQFLRLERLFMRIDHHLKLESEFDSQAAVTLALELSNCTTRGDLKNEVIKELERQQHTLRALENDPYLNADELHKLLTQLQELQHAVYDCDGKLSGHLRNDEMLNTIQQRNFVAGGGCDFDLPAYHLWLQQPLGKRQQLIEYWLSPFVAVKAAIYLSLQVLRLSGNSQAVTAQGGYFEHSPAADLPVQLISIKLGKDINYYPELSAGKHRFNVRFFEMQNSKQRPNQILSNCEFVLTLCGL